MDRGMEGQRDRGTEGQRDRGYRGDRVSCARVTLNISGILPLGLTCTSARMQAAMGGGGFQVRMGCKFRSFRQERW
jgi:hypothetical protein